MNLIIDIGNTRAKLVVEREGDIVECLTTANDTLAGLTDLARRHAPERGIVSSVVRLTAEAEAEIAATGIEMVRLTSSTPLPLGLRFPPSMGADRIAAIVGAMTLHPAQPLLIIDAGTCVTYEVVDARGRYLGGNIAPGVYLRLEAMHEHTALLPLVAPDGDTPEEGYDTETAMRAGVLHGLEYEIEGYIRHFHQRFPALQVYLTGGDHFTFSAPYAALVHRDEHLVARGLARILSLQ